MNGSGDIRTIDLSRHSWSDSRFSLFRAILRARRLLKEDGWGLLLESGGSILLEG